ncbi:Ring finger domain containing protein [Novymonas esmeraldas]|uniref:Ring finger domain containing protein n=1 Tax=Novymonas esmeraldas TaxID=1808958 RepID=A0AAW0EPZ3_9TRYP
MAETRELPSLGPPVATWGSRQSLSRVSRNARQDKLGLWSAVALQEHFTLTGAGGGLHLPPSRTSAIVAAASHSPVHRGGGGGSDRPSPLSSVSGASRHAQRLTLAQRMGLVPGPPPPPSADDWRAVVHRALAREQHAAGDAGPHDAHASVCPICQLGYAATGDEGQVILSCSHVFHAQCFRAFERCIRAQQRADAVGIAEMAAPLACPVCRTQHYHKRVFFEGKALAQRAAIVKAQAIVRGHLARRAYTTARLSSNAEFRTRFVQERLARLSAAWETFCASQEQSRAVVLAALAVQQQAARAACLSEEAWAGLWTRVVNGSSSPSSSARAATPSASAVVLQCPICLERIRCRQCPGTRVGSRGGGAHGPVGAEAVSALRLAYEARQAAKRLPALEPKTATTAPKAPAAATGAALSSKSVKGRRAPPRHPPQSREAAATHDPAPTPTSAALLTSLESGGAGDGAGVPPQSGVLLSCGHYFHAACIGCYERFNERTVAERAERAGPATVVVANRCPICRSGYAKHPL